MNNLMTTHDKAQRGFSIIETMLFTEAYTAGAISAARFSSQRELDYQKALRNKKRARLGLNRPAYRLALESDYTDMTETNGVHTQGFGVNKKKGFKSPKHYWTPNLDIALKVLLDEGYDLKQIMSVSDVPFTEKGVSKRINILGYRKVRQEHKYTKVEVAKPTYHITIKRAHNLF